MKKIFIGFFAIWFLAILCSVFQNCNTGSNYPDTENLKTAGFPSAADYHSICDCPVKEVRLPIPSSENGPYEDGRIEFTDEKVTVKGEELAYTGTTIMTGNGITTYTYHYGDKNAGRFAIFSAVGAPTKQMAFLELKLKDPNNPFTANGWMTEEGYNNNGMLREGVTAHEEHIPVPTGAKLTHEGQNVQFYEDKLVYCGKDFPYVGTIVIKDRGVSQDYTYYYGNSADSLNHMVLAVGVNAIKLKVVDLQFKGKPRIQYRL